MDAKRLILWASLTFAFVGFQPQANAATPLINCTGSNQALQSTASPPTYSCATVSGGGSGSPGGMTGQIQYNAGSGNFGGLTLTGDCTMVYTTGVITCTKTNGVNFATSATTDTTNAANISTGTLLAARMPAFTGDVSTSGGATINTLATVNANVGAFGSSTAIPNFTVNAKGLLTAAGANAVIAPAGTLTGTTLASGITSSSLTSFGAGIALGTPASGVATNLTGTASGMTAGTVSTINGLITAGSNVTITGSGTSGSPYSIASSGSGGSVSVTAASPDIVITPSPGTGTFTIGASSPINAQGATTPYTILSSDMGKTVTNSKTTSVAITLPQAGTTGFLTGASYGELNLGAGAVTITPTTSTINGASSQILHQYGWTFPISDGTNWQSLGFPGYGTITSGAMMKFTSDASGAMTAATSGTDYQAPITLTTTGTSGAATLIGSTLNIPQYTGGGGSGTVNSGTAGQVAYYAGTGTAVSGEALSALIDSAIGSTQGNIIYRGASTWSVLAPGTSGFFLQTQGAAANPVWASASAGGVSSFTGDGVIISNSASTGAVTDTLVNAAANSVLGNNTGSPAIPAYQTSINLTGTAATAAHTITSASATSLAVGANGITNPVLTVDDSTASVASGVAIKGAATGVATTITATDSGSNAPLTINTKGTGTLTLQGGTGGPVNIAPSGGTRAAFAGAITTFTPAASATQNHFLYTGPADTTMSASTEIPAEYWNNAAATRSHSTGALSIERDFLITGASDAFIASSTLANAATFGVVLKSAGTNATVTNSSGIYIPTSTLTGTITNSYGLNIVAATGATNNYSALFNGPMQALNLTGASTPQTSALCLDGSGNVIADSVNCIAGGSGTVTSITATAPLTGGTITGSGSIGIQNASASQLGAVQGDGSTITINGSGIASCTTSTASQIGCVKPDNSTITISAGVISAVGGGGSGTVSSATTGQYAVYTGSTTVSGSSVITTSNAKSIVAMQTEVALTMFGGI